MKKFIKDFRLGVTCFFKSWPIIFGKGLWHFMLYPLILKIILYIIIFYGIWHGADLLQIYLDKQFNFQSIPDSGHWLSWMKPFLTGWFSKIIIWILKLFVGWFMAILMKNVVLIFISPILSLAGEKAEEKITGVKYPFDFKQLCKDIVRGSLIAFRNMFFQLLFFFAGLVILWIPAIGPFLCFVYQVFFLFVSWYFYGFSLLDYSCERRRMGVKDSSQFIKKNKGVACGIGCMFWAFLLIPVIGEWIGLFFAPIMGVVGATMAYLEVEKSLVKPTIIHIEPAG